jgi:isocitrate dehydrogenase (NAD+)
MRDPAFPRKLACRPRDPATRPARGFPAFMSNKLVVIPGDGIGPEIMQATLRVLDVLEIGFEYEFVDAGLVAREKHGELLPPATLDAIARHRVALKGPLTTPVGTGFSSLNVALRKHFDLYANVRPAITFPGTRARYSDIDIITVRENTEGAYLSEGQTVSADGEVAESLVRNTRHGSERIVRYAFEMARRQGRRKVTVVHKANILKTSSGMFLDVARAIRTQYPEIECNEMIVDNCCMQLVMNPHQFDVIVTTNLFGDILSDLCAGLVGGLGLAPGANIGSDAAIFEAVHGSAPDIAGKGIANPGALLLAAAQMLDHLGMRDPATRIRAALRATLAAGDRTTPDVGGHGTTTSFADAIIAHLLARA